MQSFLWVLISIVAYVGGLIIFARVTPRLLSHSFDEVFFMGGAALDILGALLAFGAIVLTFAMFNGAFPVRVLNFLLLVGILIVTLRTAVYCIRPRVGTTAVSRALTGGYGFFLAAASAFYIVQLFISR
ncbi:MAG: hypothetical protein JO011_20710 [Ktedonobacteraceae bacterium]|nr:hypothetical protein [Ktedonobacteraceae bacterium]MBV9713331.1 hypothetical protein [Ktedonobacteraceae bacterium]